MFIRIEFILNFSHHFLEDVLQGNDSVYAPELIPNQGHMDLPFHHFSQCDGEGCVLGEHGGRLGKRLQVDGRAFAQESECIFDVNDAQAMIQIPMQRGRRVWPQVRAISMFFSRES